MSKAWELSERITEYMSMGGLVNPELMDHRAVSFLLYGCREEFLAEQTEPKSSIWVLTREINEYDQDGEYFVAAWNEKPTHQMLTELGVPQNSLRRVLNGGGRVEFEHEWFYLKE